MPIATSEIIETSPQRVGTRITERHTTSAGEERIVRYKCPPGVDPQTVLAQRVEKLNVRLKARELERYLDRIEQGKNVIGLPYQETTQAERAVHFLQWARDAALEGEHHKLRYAHLLIDQFTEAQIDNLLGAGKGAKVKAWAERIRQMVAEMDASQTAAEDI